MITIDLTWLKFKRDEQILKESQAIKMEWFRKIKDVESLSLAMCDIVPHIACNNSGMSSFVLQVPHEENNEHYNEAEELIEDTMNVQIAKTLSPILGQNPNIESAVIDCSCEENKELDYLYYNTNYNYKRNEELKKIIIK